MSNLESKDPTKENWPRDLISTNAELNVQEILEIVGGDWDLCFELLTIFLDECPRMLSAVRDAIAESDSTALQRSAHTLKGASSAVAAHSCVEIAFTLEQLGREGRVLQSSQHFSLLERKLDRVAASIRALQSSRLANGI